MSRTFRRRGERPDYDWVLRDYRWVNGELACAVSIGRLLDDTERGASLVSPHLRHRLNTLNARQLCHWLDDPVYEPVCRRLGERCCIIGVRAVNSCRSKGEDRR